MKLSYILSTTYSSPGILRIIFRHIIVKILLENYSCLIGIKWILIFLLYNPALSVQMCYLGSLWVFLLKIMNLILFFPLRVYGPILYPYLVTNWKLFWTSAGTLLIYFSNICTYVYILYIYLCKTFIKRLVINNYQYILSK